jgi:cytochrome c peroxidase
VLFACTIGTTQGNPPAGTRGAAHEVDGRTLFERETFGGNGRTCRTCHSTATGTLSPADIAQLPADHPLFQHDGTDDFARGTQRVREHATILVRLPLPAGVTLVASSDPLDQPGSGSVVLRRGIPSTFNAPALDPVLMYDGRAPSLEAQALDAVRGHAQGTVEPDQEQLESIAFFERSLFSSLQLFNFAHDDPEPQLPAGTTPEEQRGRAFFAPGGRCAGCHGGPMLNDAAGRRFFDVMVSQVNALGNPVKTFSIRCADGTSKTIQSPDPGRVLITGACEDIDQFKVPSLWNVASTAPYFHDNSAATLEAVVSHYAELFAARGLPPLGDQDQADIVAFMKLLRVEEVIEEPSSGDHEEHGEEHGEEVREDDGELEGEEPRGEEPRGEEPREEPRGEEPREDEPYGGYDLLRRLALLASAAVTASYDPGSAE